MLVDWFGYQWKCRLDSIQFKDLNLRHHFEHSIYQSQFSFLTTFKGEDQDAALVCLLVVCFLLGLILTVLHCNYRGLALKLPTTIQILVWNCNSDVKINSRINCGKELQSDNSVLLKSEWMAGLSWCNYVILEIGNLILENFVRIALYLLD